MTERPVSRTQLPFRAFRDPSGAVQLEFFGTLLDGQKSPFRVQVGEPGGQMDLQCYPYGQNAYRLMEMFWELEKQIDGLAKERDELREKLAVAEGGLRECQKRVEGMKAQKRDK